MDKYNPMTVIGLNTQNLDYKKPYGIDFIAQAGAQVAQFRIKFTKNTGLVIQAYSELIERFKTYEFIESPSSAPLITIQHKNGMTSTISCSVN